MTKAKQAMGAGVLTVPMAEMVRRAREIERDMQAFDAAKAAERARREAAEAKELAVKAMLSAESEAFSEAGLVAFDGSDAKGHVPMRYHEQTVVLLNPHAHPSALLATTLARAERAQAFARILEQSDLVQQDGHLEAGTYTLARMIEEVVDLLQVVQEHDAIRQAPPSAMSAA